MNLYSLVKPLLFCLNPETAHNLAITTFSFAPKFSNLLSVNKNYSNLQQNTTDYDFEQGNAMDYNFFQIITTDYCSITKQLQHQPFSLLQITVYNYKTMGYITT